MHPLRCLSFLLALFAGQLSAENWNGGWQFRREGEAAWQRCTLPHSEAIPYFLGSDFRCGVVEYCKELVVPESWRGQRVFLELEAAFQDCRVCIDGHEAARHQGGYTSFRADLTPWASPGRHLGAYGWITAGSPLLHLVRVNTSLPPGSIETFTCTCCLLYTRNTGVSASRHLKSAANAPSWWSRPSSLTAAAKPGR